MLGISRYTVAEYLRRAGVVGITWPVPPELDDVALERKLFTPVLSPFAPDGLVGRKLTRLYSVRR